MTTLKPCPFCGKQVALIDNCHELEDCENFERCEATGYYAVVCDVNEGGCGASGGYARTEQEAVAAWNRRTDAVPVVRGEWIVDECDSTDDVPSRSWIDFHCSECNTDYGLEEGQYGWCRYEKIPYQYCPNCGAKIGGEKHE